MHINTIDDLLSPGGRSTEMRDARVTAFSLALGEAIHSLKSVPSGTLYAQVLGAMTLDEYNASIARLVNTGLVRNSGHMLTWEG